MAIPENQLVTPTEVAAAKPTSIGGSIKRELHSRKYRATVLGFLTLIADQVGFISNVWGWIVILVGYIAGVAIADIKANATPSTNDTNINLDTTTTGQTVARVRRTSISPVGQVTTESTEVKV